MEQKPTEITKRDVMRDTVYRIKGERLEAVGITKRSVFIWLRTQDSPIIIMRDDFN